MSPPTILLVEDDDSVRDLAGRVLRKAGYDPGAIAVNTLPPPVHIEDATIEGQLFERR